ncbi:unnamed protein product [Didymodactylos carnosus]|nr:unnamed protein product [Didymodactylos carnosus]CAF4506175.1 unnamed protein product [Didymodactylos carnosus]
MQKWIEKNHADMIRKANDYYSPVLRTLDQRQVAYRLAREFAPLFARIECCLVANVHLAKHHGLPLTIQRGTGLGAGDFFNIYPATWDSEENFIVKELINPIDDRDIAYLEAHFHRTVPRLQIPHMVLLNYLYEILKDPQQVAIVLPRHRKSFHSYLMKAMKKVSKPYDQPNLHLRSLTVSDLVNMLPAKS